MTQFFREKMGGGSLAGRKRMTSSVLIAATESLLLTVMTISGFFGIASGTSGFTGCTQWALSMQASILAVSLAILVLATSLRKSVVLANDGVGMAVSAATSSYCGSVFAVLIYYTSLFLQAVVFRDTISNIYTHQLDRSQSYHYKTSERLDWIQAAVGSGGWELRENSVYESSTSSIPVLGQVYVGISMAYLGIMLLVSVYASYSATLEGEYNPLFLEPRVVAATNILVVVGMPQAVEVQFRGCGTDGSIAPSVGACIFLLLVFSDHELGWLITRLGGAVYSESIIQPTLLTFYSVIPWIVAISAQKQWPVLITSSGILSILGVAASWLAPSALRPEDTQEENPEIDNKPTPQAPLVKSQIESQASLVWPRSSPLSLFTLTGSSAQKMGRYTA